MTAPMKCRKVPDVAHLDVGHHRDRAVAHFVPQRARHVDAAGGGTFLPLELEAAADDGRRQRGRIGRRVREDEILAAGFADDARVRAVAAHGRHRSSSTCR
jgi:hypothetical protein